MRLRLLPCLGLIALATTGAGAQETASAIWAGGSRVEFGAMVDALAKADVVMIGELHDHAAGHELEARLVEAIHKRAGRLTLAMEMFERDTQLVHDEYLAGHLTGTSFESSSRPWPRYATDYKPMVEYCKANGLRVVASNVPRRYVNLVSRKGQEALKALPRESRRLLPRLPLAMDLPEGYAKQLDELFGGSHGAAPTPGMPSPANMKEAQALWDVGMAASIVSAKRALGRGVVVHVNGGMHSDSRYGIVDRIKRVAPRLKVAVVSIRPDAAFEIWSTANAGIADYLILTAPPAPR
ncbi:MAG: ChaN family lipoprotein [Armatimonadetes bacterium]|nr:ChaN family lipoprotein [Armatimonadota bacterium]